MELLPLSFRKDGFKFEQVRRFGKVAIYKQTKIGNPANVHYEVGIIQENQPWEAFGKKHQARESWPKSKRWGLDGFTYQDLAHAEAQMAALIKRGLKQPSAVLTLPSDKNAPTVNP